MRRESGLQEGTWVVPADVSDLKFGCTFPGHYKVMQGTFTVSG
jgi:azurin